MATDSDAAVRKRIAAIEKDLHLAQKRGMRWTTEKLQQHLDYWQAQLAKPRSERMQWEHGSI